MRPVAAIVALALTGFVALQAQAAIVTVDASVPPRAVAGAAGGELGLAAMTPEPVRADRADFHFLEGTIAAVSAAPAESARALPPGGSASGADAGSPPQPVPLPGAFPLLLVAMGLFSLARRRER